MRRSRNPTPFALKDIHLNPETNLYEKKQDGITYGMPLELTRHLKDYYHHYHPGLSGKLDYPSMDKWYRDLSNEQKKQVVRTGNVPKDKSDFFPDPEYPD